MISPDGEICIWFTHFVKAVFPVFWVTFVLYVWSESRSDKLLRRFKQPHELPDWIPKICWQGHITGQSKKLLHLSMMDIVNRTRWATWSQAKGYRENHCALKQQKSDKDKILNVEWQNLIFIRGINQNSGMNTTSDTSTCFRLLHVLNLRSWQFYSQVSQTDQANHTQYTKHLNHMIWKGNAWESNMNLFLVMMTMTKLTEQIYHQSE